MTGVNEALNEDKTRERLLEVAGSVFAEKGLAATTVRDICTRAGTNIASVNYHFGSKEKLYEQAITIGICRSQTLSGDWKFPDPTDPPEKRLAAMIRLMMGRMLDPSKPAWHGKLIAREMVDPSPFFDRLIDEVIRPIIGHWSLIVGELLNAPPESPLVRRTVRSVVGQIVFYKHCRPVIDRVFPDQQFGPEDLETLAHHLATFSLGGIRAIKDRAP